MGLPSIVTNINGCNEIIQDKYNGLIIPAKNSDKLYGAMKILVEDERYRSKLASNARQNIISKYKREILWVALLEEYNAMIKRNDN